MKKQFILLFAILFCGFAYSQTIVYPGDNQLSAAIATASDGAVLQLVAGDYNETTLFNLGTLNKRITILGRANTSDARPVVRIRTAPDGTSTPNFFFLGDSAALTVKGVEFDGTDASNKASVAHLTQFKVPDPAKVINIHRIEFDDCLIHDLTDNVIDGGNSSFANYVVCDTTIVSNSIIHNTTTVIYYKYSSSDYISAKNSTFYKIGSYGVRITGPNSTGLPTHCPDVYVDHTTWNDVGAGDPREILLQDGSGSTGHWYVTNSIFANQVSTGGSKTVINIKGTTGDSLATVTNICMWMIDKVTWYSHTVKDTITADPQFKDAANGDFTVQNSTLLTYGSDGKAVGDPRWAGVTAIEDQGVKAPLTFALHQNYPNPFNPSTKITFSLNKAQMTDLVVYNLLGQEVAKLVHGNLTAGEHVINFDASNLPSGVYIYRLSTSSQQISKKMILMK